MTTRDRRPASEIDAAEMVVSAAEERFEHWRRTIGFFAGPVVFLLLWFVPLPALSREAHRLSAVVSLVVVWWISEAIPIPITALIGSALTVVCGIATAQDAFAPFANPVIFLFIGSFMIGIAASAHRLDRRLAFALMALPAVRGVLSRIRLALGGLTLAMSGWMSNTATTAMMLPVATGVLTASNATRLLRGQPFATGFLLTIAYAATVGGIMTPVGSPPNLITLGMLDRILGIRIPFFTWMLMMVPIAVVLGAVMFAIGALLFPAPARGGAAAASYVKHEEHEIGPWTRGQLNCVLAFGAAVVLWVTPGVIAIGGWSETTVGRIVTSRLDEGVVAIVAASLLFLLPTDWQARKFTLEWTDAAKIDWGTILLFGGGLSLGRLMFVTGLAEHVGTGLVAVSGTHSLWSVTAMAVALGILLSEITSNTAAINMLVPVVLSICAVASLNPVPPALGACLGASMGSMLPISTPPNAIVYGTGLVPITAMIRFGVLLDIVSFIIILAGLRLMCPLFGFA